LCFRQAYFRAYLEASEHRTLYLLTVNGGTAPNHPADYLHNAAFGNKELFFAQFLDGVIKAKTANFRPIVITLKQPDISA